MTGLLRRRRAARAEAAAAVETDPLTVFHRQASAADVDTSRSGEQLAAEVEQLAAERDQLHAALTDALGRFTASSGGWSRAHVPDSRLDTWRAVLRRGALPAPADAEAVDR